MKLFQTVAAGFRSFRTLSTLVSSHGHRRKMLIRYKDLFFWVDSNLIRTFSPLEFLLLYVLVLLESL